MEKFLYNSIGYTPLIILAKFALNYFIAKIIYYANRIDYLGHYKGIS